MGEAIFSKCGQYRYFLSRKWKKGKGCVFVMLNPHKANESLNDPTIIRCIGFARDWGYGGIEVVNLFGYCCKNPIDLQKIEDPVG